MLSASKRFQRARGVFEEKKSGIPTNKGSSSSNEKHKPDTKSASKAQTIGNVEEKSAEVVHRSGGTSVPLLEQVQTASDEENEDQFTTPVQKTLDFAQYSKSDSDWDYQPAKIKKSTQSQSTAREIDIGSYMESEVDAIFTTSENIWTEWLLRPKKIGFKYESPFDLEEPQFEIRLLLTPEAVIRAYAWLRHALIYCGYQVHRPNGDDLTLFRQDYETKHYVYNYMLDRMAQTIFQFDEWLSTYHPSVSGSEVTLKKSNRSSLSSKKSTIAWSQEAVAGVTDLAEG
ncbi:hypothetical protein AC1031_011452 [Aphanomyces cochlioides]|nr:hypothetical protein AC1031_011452 [Aphanomyces cochlioides]